MFLLKVLPMFYPKKTKNAVTYSVTTFCKKFYALCLVVPPGIVINSQVAVYHHFSETSKE